MALRYADGGDKCRLFIGLFSAFVFGAALPGFCFAFGAMIDDMGEGTGLADMDSSVLNMVYVACIVWVCSFFQVGFLGIFSTSIGTKMKIDYFAQALRKDADFYDVQNPNEMASKIAKEVAAVQRGTGEKIGTIMMSVSSFILGYVAAFYFGWKLTLILLVGLPAVLLSGVAMGASFETGAVESMKAYAQSAGYAEQALQSVKIVHTYCNELVELTNYTKYLGRAKAK